MALFISISIQFSSHLCRGFIMIASNLKETGKKKIMMRVMKNVMGWRKEEVALAQVTRKGFLEMVTFEL